MAHSRLLRLAFVLAITGCSPPPAPPPPLEGSKAASITGRIRVNGEIPAPGLIRVDGDPQCRTIVGSDHIDSEEIVVGRDNGLQHALIYIKEGLTKQEYAIRQEPVVLDQQKCRYTPRVLGVQVGQAVTLRNSDPLLHTVRGDATRNQRFDIATPMQGMEIRRTFDRVEMMVPIKCDMHPWMQAYIGVLDHPFFAVTREDGTFSIDGVPHGTYVIEVWHEHLGTQRRNLTVPSDGATDVSFTYQVR